MATRLLGTKLYIPPLQPGLVHRPRLTRLINEGLARRLMLVSAPAGFGKTTLLCEWISVSRRRVSWLSLEEADNDRFQLLGITDTSMLRPQVFAIQEGEVSIGLIASEKQAIDATLVSLAQDDQRFRHVADRYWNARGGSHTDGGAFIFSLDNNSTGALRMSWT